MENFGQSLKTLVAQVKRVKNKLSGQIDEVDKKLSSKIDRVDDRVKENLELTETVKTELDMIQATTEVIEVRMDESGNDAPTLSKPNDIHNNNARTRRRFVFWTRIPGSPMCSAGFSSYVPLSGKLSAEARTTPSETH